jgi:hypothetical protein
MTVLYHVSPLNMAETGAVLQDDLE